MGTLAGPSSYQEWRKRISVYHLKMELQKRSVEAVLNLIGSLQGTAWKLDESCDVTKIDEERSFDEVIAILDAAFKYDARVRMPQDFDAYFRLSRSPGTTLLNYATEHDEKLRKLSEHGRWCQASRSGAGLQLDQRAVPACAFPGSEA